MKKDLSKKISLLLCSTLFLSSVVGPSFVGATKGKTDSAANSDNSRKSATAVKRPRDVRGKEEEPVRKRKPVIVVTEEPISEVAKPDTATESAEDEPPVLMPVPTTAEGENAQAAASAQTQPSTDEDTKKKKMPTYDGTPDLPIRDGAMQVELAMNFSEDENRINQISLQLYKELCQKNKLPAVLEAVVYVCVPDNTLGRIVSTIETSGEMKNLPGLSELAKSLKPIACEIGNFSNIRECRLRGELLNEVMVLATRIRERYLY